MSAVVSSRSLAKAALGEIVAAGRLELARQRKPGLGLPVAAAAGPDAGLVDQPLHSEAPCQAGSAL